MESDVIADEVVIMASSGIRHTFSDRLVSRGGAWLALGLALLILAGLFGALGQADAPAGTAQAPTTSESAQAEELLDAFPDADQQSVLVVVSRTDGEDLTSQDLADVESQAPALEDYTDGPISEPVVSDDGQAALLVTPIEVGESNTETAEVIGDLRSEISAFSLTGLELQVTGGPAFGADIASAFDNADFTLLAVTIAIVAVLLIVTYRSPILWLIPLTVVAIADRAASVVTTSLGAEFDLRFDAGIISVLVFGAGTNYALLLISRYREELPSHADHREALSVAWRKAVPAVLASNVTTVLAVLTLALAAVPDTQGIGITAAAGLVLALAAILFVLPPVLAVCGRRIFWPFVPRPGEQVQQGRVWSRIATQVMKRPAASLASGVALLGVMTAGLLGTSVGLDQMEKFRVQSESAVGLEVLSEHFPPGEAQPIWIVANSEGAEDVTAAAQDVEGVVRAHPSGESEDESLTQIMVTSEYTPDTDQSLDQITELRDAAHAVDEADALVGGAVASEADARDGSQRDLLTIAPLVLTIIFVGLLILLRSIVAPVLLLVVNLASSVAAIGAGAWLSRVLFDQPALDHQVPLLAFLFLVALGIDYTIFLVLRARSETGTYGTREGMRLAVSRTGSVITSAGIVLAGVFAALGLLPLVTLGQLGLIVAIGVIVDTFIVRSVVVPAIFGLLGERIWWPSRPARSAGESTYEHRERTLDPS